VPAIRAIHWNTPKADGKTRCGRPLEKVTWREDVKDVTCDRCLDLIALDEKKAP
jgi:hypothetical protein